MLSLYYRWALQSLSAFSFIHSRSIYIISFSSPCVWLRSDCSLAITGLISAVTSSEYLGKGEWSSEYMEEFSGDEGAWASDEWPMYDETGTRHGVQGDLFYWATFIRT